MKKKKAKESILERFSAKDLELVTIEAEKRTDVPLVQSKQINMRLSADILSQARRLAKAQGKPVTTFLATLLKEDIVRLWSIFKLI